MKKTEPSISSTDFFIKCFFIDDINLFNISCHKYFKNINN